MKIRSFLFGFIFGAALLASFHAIAADEKPRIIGPDGVLEGLEVTNFHGDRVCEDPYYYNGTKKISCE